jgi:hypothetical protein
LWFMQYPLQIWFHSTQLKPFFRNKNFPNRIYVLSSELVPWITTMQKNCSGFPAHYTRCCVQSFIRQKEKSVTCAVDKVQHLRNWISFIKTFKFHQHKTT